MTDEQESTNRSKKEAVESMFDAIAWRYDFLNHFLSLNIDRMWRRRAIKMISYSCKNPDILDVATGTGDLAIAAMKLDPVKITGVDIASRMLEIGREKISKLGYSDIISLENGDSENLRFSDDTFDVAMVAFGVRNFADPVKGLSEMRRVVRSGGMVMVLEFSKPTGTFFRHLYNFYFLKILPLFGRLFSKDKAAYKYLPDSVMKFPDNEAFLELMERAGWKNSGQVKLTGGIASIYTAYKL